MKNILLFLSAFVPMYCLIIFKILIEIINKNLSFNFLNSFMLISMLILTGSGIYGIVRETILNKEPSKQIIIIKQTNLTDQHFFGYFSLFVLFSLTFELERFSMSVIFFLILIMLGIVYTNNNLFYINPFLNLLGYNFYEITYKLLDDNNEKNMKIFYKGNQIKLNQKYWAKVHNQNFAFIDSKKI